MQEDEQVQDEDEEEAPAINLIVGIGWLPKTNFDGVDTETLFDDHFNPRNIRQQGGDGVTTTNIVLQYPKNTVNSPIKYWRSIFTQTTLYLIVKYTNDYGSFNTKEWEDM